MAESRIAALTGGPKPDSCQRRFCGGPKKFSTKKAGSDGVAAAESKPWALAIGTNAEMA
jgi:hypothetical protein